MHRIRSNIIKVVIILVSFVFCQIQLSAQSNINEIYYSSPPGLSCNNSDTTETTRLNPPFSNTQPINKSKSTGIAILLSAALPGAGQFYNESYWKIPVILGLGSYWVYEWVQMNNELRTYKSKYSESLMRFPPSGNYQYKNLRDFYRSERDKFAWYLGILYVLNIVDAYVDASLFEFSVDENLANSTNLGHYGGFKLKIFFPD